MSLAVPPKNNTKSHKASSVRCSRCYRGGNDGQTKVFITEGLCCQRRASSLRFEKVPVFVPLRGKRLWCTEGLNHWFDKVSQLPQPWINYWTGLPNAGCRPPDPVGSLCLWLSSLEIHNINETRNCFTTKRDKQQRLPKKDRSWRTNDHKEKKVTPERNKKMTTPEACCVCPPAFRSLEYSRTLWLYPRHTGPPLKIRAPYKHTLTLPSVPMVTLDHRWGAAESRQFAGCKWRHPKQQVKRLVSSLM